MRECWPRNPLQCYRETCGAFCAWAKLRGYLTAHPLEGGTGFDAALRTKRHALTPDKIHKLLNKCNPRYRLLCEVAICSGLRARKLRSILTLR